MPNTFTKVFPFYYLLLTAVYSNFYYSSFFSSLLTSPSPNSKSNPSPNWVQSPSNPNLEFGLGQSLKCNSKNDLIHRSEWPHPQERMTSSTRENDLIHQPITQYTPSSQWSTCSTNLLLNMFIHLMFRMTVRVTIRMTIRKIIRMTKKSLGTDGQTISVEIEMLSHLKKDLKPRAGYK